MNAIRYIVISLALGLICSIGGAQNCGSVIDNANVLNKTTIQHSVSQLENVGAEAHFYTAETLGGAATLDAVETSLEQSCPSWRVNGVRKNNLVVLLVATKARKIGVIYGSSFHKALDTNFLNVTADMKPKFRDGDWTGGFVQGANSTISYIKAARVVSGGRTTIVNQEATDYSGFYSFLKWFLFVAVLGGLIFWAWKEYVYNRKKEEDRLDAQHGARSVKAEAIEAVANMTDQIAQTKLQVSLDALTGSVKYDVETPELSAAEYDDIAAKYNRIISLSHPVLSYFKPKENVQTSRFSDTINPQTPKEEYIPSPNSSTPPYTPIPSSTSRTTVVNNYGDRGSGYMSPFYTPPVVIVEEPIIRDSYIRDSYRDNSYDNSRSDDSGGGGSDAWSSNDSDSSSGGSDSFDSSDSGGGGSDDF